MTPFTKVEQWEHDYDLFMADPDGRIAHFSHFGFRLLPPSIAKSKENWRQLKTFFHSLPLSREDYFICPDLQKHLPEKSILDFEGYIKPSAEMSQRGLYSFDSYDFSFDERPYYRVTNPKIELRINNLPEEIQILLEELTLYGINFSETSLISEEIVKNL